MMIGIDDSYKDGILEGLKRYMVEAEKRKDAVMCFSENQDGTFAPCIALSLSEAKPTTKLSERYVIPFDYDNVTKKVIMFAGENLKKIPEDKMSELFDCLQKYSGEESDENYPRYKVNQMRRKKNNSTNLKSKPSCFC